MQTTTEIEPNNESLIKKAVASTSLITWWTCSQ